MMMQRTEKEFLFLVATVLGGEGWGQDLLFDIDELPGYLA
jgi:hypothetical protein